MAGCGASGPIKARVAESPRTFCNPVNVDYRFMKIDGGDGIREAADPVVVEFGGRYYLFASKSSGYWHTEDFVEWTHVLIDDTVLPFYGCDESIGLNILAHAYNTNPEMVVTGKMLEPMHKEAMMWDVERGVPDRPQEKPWQTCTCIGGWHYGENDYNAGYKSAEQVISMLIDIVSKNGNLLLSIPIKGDGTLDDKEMKFIADMNPIEAMNTIHDRISHTKDNEEFLATMNS